MKSQVKLFESIVVLIIFVFLVAIGIKFYTNTQLNAVKEISEEISTLDALKTTVILANMPDIACSLDADVDLSCIDLYKITAWEHLMNTTPVFVDKYISLVGLSEIYIERVYPSPRTWLIYNASIEKSSYTITGSTYISVPTIIYSPVDKRNQLGILHVRTFAVTT